MDNKMDNHEETTAAAENTPPIALKFAPAWKRVVSFLIDKIIIAIILDILIFLIYRNEFLPIMMQQDFNLQLKLLKGFMDSRGFTISIAQFIIEASYFALGWKANGQTIGARIMRIIVMSVEKKRLSILQGIVRYSLIALSAVALYIPQLIVFNPIYHQRLHDFITASVVVEVPETKEKDKKNTSESPKGE